MTTSTRSYELYKSLIVANPPAPGELLAAKQSELLQLGGAHVVGQLDVPRPGDDLTVLWVKVVSPARWSDVRALRPVVSTSAAIGTDPTFLVWLER